jgi:hypothetical protein
MPEQLREALEEATLTRRQAMEKAFDDLSGDSEGDGAGSGSGESSGRAGSDSGGSEQVIKTGGEREEWVVDEKTPIVDDTKKPLKPLGKTAQAAKGLGKEGAKVGDKGAKQEDGKQTPTSKYKPPNTWKPDAREHFNSLPERVQEEVTRREGEITKVLNETAAVRRWAGEFSNIYKPFEGLIRASGATPMQAVSNLMNTAATLQTGTMAQKVSIVRDMIRIYGVDLATLDAALAGKGAPKEAQNNQALEAALDARLKPINEFITRVNGSRQQSQQALQQEVGQTATEFENDPANEFYNDLREDMADILDLAANRGREMTLKQAYDLAAKQHPEISKVVSQRDTAAKAAKDAQNLQRSRRAASSTTQGTPGGTGMQQGKPTNRREAISQAWDDLSGR